MEWCVCSGSDVVIAIVCVGDLVYEFSIGASLMIGCAAGAGTGQGRVSVGVKGRGRKCAAVGIGGQTVEFCVLP